MQALLRVLLVVCLAIPSVAAAEIRPRPLQSAMSALRSGDWDKAYALAERDGPAARLVIDWHRFRAGKGTYREAMEFLTQHADWPGLPWMRRRTERVLDQAEPQEVVDFFDGRSPETGYGALFLSDALAALGETGAAEAEIVLAWRTLKMSDLEEARFLGAHAELLADHHAARLDAMLWQGNRAEASRLLELVEEPDAALALARMAVMNRAGNASERIKALPEDAKDDAGLAHAQFEHLIKQGRRDTALDLILDRSASAERLGEPENWARRRAILARQLMRQGDAESAYALAASHHLTEGSRFADLEWLAGYLALTHLDQPDVALFHFERFNRGVATPISLGRAGYWLGRAHEALGNTDQAFDAYRAGGAHQTSFYGLLAAAKADLPTDPALTGARGYPDWRQADFVKSTVFQAALLLRVSGQPYLAERFLTHLSESLSIEETGSLGLFLEDLNEPHLQVMVGKRAASLGVSVPRPYYALHPLRFETYPVPLEMVLAIARRESEFDQGVVSGAGARGLMQVMPRTARQVLRRIGGEYDSQKMLTDWVYNARIGAAYLETLADEFGGNVVMMAAAYNAGPSRPRNWMTKYGDPRKGDIDVVDWVEMIPFDETRNYVMRVAESLPVYRARLGRAPHPVPFDKELIGSTLKP